MVGLFVDFGVDQVWWQEASCSEFHIVWEGIFQSSSLRKGPCSHALGPLWCKAKHREVKGTAAAKHPPDLNGSALGDTHSKDARAISVWD